MTPEEAMLLAQFPVTNSLLNRQANSLLNYEPYPQPLEQYGGPGGISMLDIASFAPGLGTAESWQMGEQAENPLMKTLGYGGAALDVMTPLPAGKMAASMPFIVGMTPTQRAIKQANKAAKAAGGERKIAAKGRSGKAQQNYVGAPYSVTGPKSLKDSDDMYYRYVSEGAPARDFYEDMKATNALLRHGDMQSAERFSGGTAVTSASTGLQGNYGHAVKAHNQAMVGDPVQAGIFPNNMGPKIERVYSGELDIGDIGAKTGPFAVHGAPGRSHDRAVHDIWDGRARGYKTKSGKPWDQGFGPSQHAFMDRQDERVVELLNRDKVGGFDDWTADKAQAAAWAAKRVEAGEIKPEEMYARYGQFLPQRRAYGTRESAPGHSTGHMTGFDELPWDVRTDYHNNLLGMMQDDIGRDRIAHGYGALVEPNVQTVGIYEGRMNPGTHVPVQVGQVKGGPEIDPSSAKMMDAIESTYGLIGAQDAAAWGRMYNPKRVSDISAGQLSIGRTLRPEELKNLEKAVFDRFGENAYLVPTADGFNLIPGTNPPGKKDLQLFTDEVVSRIIPEDIAANPRGYSGNFIMNDWRDQPYGQGYVDTIEGLGSERIIRAFDDFAPGLAGAVRRADERAAKEFGLSVGPEIQKMRRALEEGGWAGLNKLIKTGALPAVLVSAVLPFMPAQEGEFRGH